MKLEDIMKTTDAELANDRAASNIDILKTEFEVFIARAKGELKKIDAAEKKETTDFVRSFNDGEPINTAAFIHGLADREIERQRIRQRLEVIEKKYAEYFG